MFLRELAAMVVPTTESAVHEADISNLAVVA